MTQSNKNFRPALIPHPQNWETTEDFFPLRGPFILDLPAELEFTAPLITEALAPFGETEISVSTSKAQPSLTLELEEGEDEESYKLKICREQIRICGPRSGILHGIATLRQLLLQVSDPGSPSLRGAVIRDYPKYPWRGLLLDCSRHFFSLEKVLQYIDLLSLLKMNRFHWHLTDDQGWRLEIKQYPKLTEVGAWRGKPHAKYGGYYTQEEVRAVVAYAAERGVEVIPEIDIPGHSTAIVAAYPELGCDSKPVEVETEWGIMTVNLNPGKEETFTFLEGVFEEVAELFPSKWIHLGADECQKEPWQASEACRKRIAEEGLKDERELQTWFINRVLKILDKHNRVGIGWDEVLEGGLPENIIVQSWQNHAFTAEAARLGAQVIATPVPWCYINYATSCLDLARVHSFNPLPDELEPEFQEQILGGECTLWTEFITENVVDYLAFPRLLATAEALWKPEGRPASYDHFESRVERFYPMLSSLGIKYGPAKSLQDPHHAVYGRVRDFHPMSD